MHTASAKKQQTRPGFSAHLQNDDKLRKKSVLFSLHAATHRNPSSDNTHTRASSTSGKDTIHSHPVFITASPLPFQLSNSSQGLLSQEIIFGEQYPKDMHSIHFSNFSNIHQSTNRVHILTKLLWLLVEFLLLNCIWHHAPSKHWGRRGEAVLRNDCSFYWNDALKYVVYQCLLYESPKRHFCLAEARERCSPEQLVCF